MRLWHKDLIPMLPNSQLVAQWRELNSIFKKKDKHILINYIYEYDEIHLYKYTMLVIDEIKKRNFQIKSYSNMNNYFSNFVMHDDIIGYDDIFIKHHNKDYLMMCYYNLKEKYIRGQKDFTFEQFAKIHEFIILGRK